MSLDPTRIRLATDPLAQRMTGVTSHGHIPFDVPFLTEITPGLWQGGTADGLVLPGHIAHLVSLYPWESYWVRHELGSRVEVRMRDSIGADMRLVGHLARWVQECRATGPVLVACQAGLNRSSLVMARVLMLNGLTAVEAIEMIREKRSPACLCNPAFEAWLLAADGRAGCPACGRRVLLTKAGRLRAHLPQAGAADDCPGSSRLPGDITEGGSA